MEKEKALEILFFVVLICAIILAINGYMMENSYNELVLEYNNLLKNCSFNGWLR